MGKTLIVGRARPSASAVHKKRLARDGDWRAEHRRIQRHNTAKLPRRRNKAAGQHWRTATSTGEQRATAADRSEERRVGKERRRERAKEEEIEREQAERRGACGDARRAAAAR